MQRPRRSGRLGPPLLLLLAGSLVACGAPAPPQPRQPAPEPATDTEFRPAIAAPTDPAPPVEPAPAAIARHGTLAIVAPETGARLTSRSLVVIGVAPSGAEVVLDGPLFLDRTVAADPWGAWSMPLTLDPGRHDLVFALAGTNATRRTLSLEIAAPATSTAPAVLWPPDGTALDADRVTLRGTAAPGAGVAVSTDDPLGALGVTLGTAGATEADAAGRWTLPVDLGAGPNRFVIASDDHAIRHAVVRDDGASPPTGVAPELAVRSLRTLAFDDPNAGPLVQVVLEVENTSGGWLDLLGGSAPTVATATGRPTALLPFPRRVAPGHTALLLGELRSAHLGDPATNPDDPAAGPPAAVDLVLAIDVGYTSAATPAQRGRVETYQLDPTPADGLSVTGRFRGGSTEPRFRVAILGYDAGGSLIAFATSGPARPGRYDACCLPLFGRDARSDLARVVGLVSGD